MKTIHELVFELRGLDIQLWVEGDKLCYQAPKESLSQSIIQQLRERKGELISFLCNAKSVKTDDSPVILPVTRTSNLPISFAQKRLWFLNQLEQNSSAYNMPTAYYLRGSLNIEALEESLNEIVRRHEILRTTFTLVEVEPQQIIYAKIEINLQIVNLKELPTHKKQIKAQQIVTEEAKKTFDLATVPLFSVQLLSLSDQEHILLLNFHHIVFDGWSFNIFFQELETLYAAFSKGLPSPLSQLHIQYADFAHWQRDWLQGEVLESQLNYWKQQFSGTLPILQLPTDRPRPPVQTYRGAKESFWLSKSLTETIKKIGQKAGATLFMTLLAAFNILLYRYTGQEDIVVGSSIPSRDRAEIEGLIGFFGNILVLRINVSGNPTFEDFLDRVRQVTIGAYSHQDLPFQKLVEELQPERGANYNPVVQVSLQIIPKKKLELPELTITPVEVKHTRALLDLRLEITETECGLECFWEYNTDLFDAARISRMSEHFQTLLEAITANPQQRIDQLPLLSETERHQLLVEWNDTASIYPTDNCIHQLFEQQVEKTPDAVAVVFEKEQLTYQQLNQRANQLAHHLQTLGVGPEVLVGICVKRSVEMVVGLLGILKAGGAYVPLDPNYPAQRLSYMLADSGVEVLLTQQQLLSSLPSHTARVFCLDTDWGSIALENGNNPNSRVKSENLAYVIYTSGSTGKPKGVLVTHKGLPNLVMAQKNQFNVQSQSRVLQFASFSFDASVSEIFMALSSGATLILSTAESLMPGPDLRKTLTQFEITHVTLPPSALSILSPDEFPALGNIIVAGETCSTKLVNQWSNGRCFFNAYGPTESTVCATVAEISDSNPKLTIGRPIANTQIYILDSNSQPAPIGVPGELHIGSVGLARGYLNRPELTQEKFIPNPFEKSKSDRLYKTGDLARYLPDGNIEFLGRIDHQIKLRGFRIELPEIETVLNQHPAVRQAAVIAREDISEDKRLVAYITSNQEEIPTTVELRRFLKQKLPEYMVPSAFVILDVIPKTPNGKVDRRALPAPERIRQEPEETFVAPRNELELQLTKIWEKVLGIQPIGIRDNFFDLGGHSLLAMRVWTEIDNNLNKKWPITTFLQFNTIEELARLLREDVESSITRQLSEESIRSPLSPKHYRHLQLFTAGWKGQRIAPNTLMVGLNTQGSKQPIFWCLNRFRPLKQLAKYLGEDQPTYGMRSGARIMRYTEQNIHALAAHYVSEILTVQPQGPYLLGGNCQGGIIALEIAQQLQRQGKRVKLLCWLEPIFKPCLLEPSLRQSIYPGRIAFFVRHKSKFNPYRSFRWPELGWRKFYTGGFSVDIVSGPHGQFFNEPNIQVVAKKLQLRLQEAQSELASPKITLSEAQYQLLPDSAYRAQLTAQQSLVVLEGETVSISVNVKNISSVTWLSSEQSSITLGNHWLDQKGKLVQWADGRVYLDQNLQPGAEIELSLPVTVPRESGKYFLELDIVEEGITWFKDKGSKTTLVDVEVSRVKSKYQIDVKENRTQFEKGDKIKLTKNSSVLRSLGNSQFEKGDFEGAIASYQKAIDFNPKQPFEVYLSLGEASSQQGLLDKAMVYFQKAIKLHDSNPHVYLNLGKAQLKQGDIKGAIASSHRAIEFDPDNFEAYKNLGDALYQQRHLKEAISAYQKALKLNSSDVMVYCRLGDAQLKKGNVDAAIACYQEAIKLQPDKTLFYYRLGDAQLKKGNVEAAIVWYQEIIKVEGRNSQVFCSFGKAQLKQGDIEGAINSYYKAIELKPQNYEAYKQLGDALYRQRHLKEAITAYKKAIIHWSGKPLIRKLIRKLITGV